MLKWFADRLAETGKDARKDERGFTLIELLVVVIIIGILAAIAIPIFLGQRANAQDADAQASVRNGATAMEAHFTQEQDYDSATAADLEDIEPSLNWAVGDAATTGTVTVTNAGDDSYELAIVSASDNTVTLTKDNSGTDIEITEPTT